ncbi:MAG: pantetheine-phosphate adenylyltransferase [Acidobacteriota bacterium]|nr:pantetheine-phosphate adenylyltransferase [Acidobacteriota bacterium]MDH3785909.1 pantetheine-phosphate adenylyltransferase [Acidobacteriota bacterium]
MKQTAVYPGTFDPVTNGHLDLVKRARERFDRVVMAILDNEDKTPLFSVEERIQLIRKAVGDPDVVVETFNGLLVDYTRQVGAGVILRGIRAVSDFEYEMQMAMMNRKLAPEVETVFLLPSVEYSFLSSRLVREVARLGGCLDGLVPDCVATALRDRYGER